MIYVFETSVKTKIQIKKLKPHIDNILSKVKWNFDVEGCDKILRIGSEVNIGLTRQKPKRYFRKHNIEK